MLTLHNSYIFFNHINGTILQLVPYATAGWEDRGAIPLPLAAELPGQAQPSPFKVRSCHYVLPGRTIQPVRSSKDGDISGNIHAKTVK